MLDLQPLERGLKHRGLLFRNRFGEPLVVVLREDLHAVAAGAAGDLYRFVVAAGDGLVGSENGHEARRMDLGKQVATGGYEAAFISMLILATEFLIV
jgi:hypothetical protein